MIAINERVSRKRKLSDLKVQNIENNENKVREWSIDDFEIGKPIGRGRFGRVYLAREKRSEHEILCALKILFKSTLVKHKTESSFKTECEIQIQLKHPNILRFLNWFHDEKKIFIVLEYAAGGSLYKKLQDVERFTNTQAATYIYQITKALKYIHSVNIIHRDIKPENILLGCFDEVKLADFGWSCKLIKEEPDVFVDTKDINNNNTFKLPSGIVGTLDYLAPEIVEYKEYDFRVDIWSLGILTYELLVGKTPFESSSINDTFNNIKQINFKFINGTNSFIKSQFFSNKAKDLISNLLVKNPCKRLTLDKVSTHSWIKKYANKDSLYENYFCYD